MKAIANAGVTKSILAEYGLHAKKRFGQNFIIDPSVVIKIAENSGTDKDTTVLEIGPGLGALSEQLALRSKKVIAFEIDTDMVNILQETVKEYPVEVIAGDFLETDLSLYNDIEKLVVCANVPYNITSPILFKLIESELPLTQITLMVQKELAERLSAQIGSKEYNALSIMMQYLFERKILSKVPKNCFYPVPKVDSIVLQLFPKARHDVQDRDSFFAFLRSCFGQRRKTLMNNLKNFVEKDKAALALTATGIEENRRPESLDLNEFILLYKALYEA